MHIFRSVGIQIYRKAIQLSFSLTLSQFTFYANLVHTIIVFTELSDDIAFSVLCAWIWLSESIVLTRYKNAIGQSKAIDIVPRA